MYDALAKNDRAGAEATRAFYDEYFAVLDLPAEFYLQTVRTIFQDHTMARARYTYRGRRVDPGAIRRTSLAAHDLCTGLKPFRKHHYLQAGVAHFGGVFNGSRWHNQIYPVLKNTILASD